MDTKRMTGMLTAMLALGGAAACNDAEDEVRLLPESNGQGPAPFDRGVPYQPDVEADDLQTQVDNELWPLPVGATWTYGAETEDGRIEIFVEVLPQTEAVWGTTATVVRDTETLDDELVEDTWDWFAQDGDGNVWYLGEDTSEYSLGEVVSNAGAWEAGVDGALPGVVMLGSPEVGAVYRQEYLPGEAEDVAQVVEVGLTVDVPAGTFEDCIKTYDVSAIEVDAVEYKYYCPGVGNVLVEEEDERVELVEYSGL